MKNLLLTATLIIVSFSNNFAQIDVSTTPLSTMLVGRYSLGVEKGLSKAFSVELNVHYSTGKILRSVFLSNDTYDNFKGFGYFTNIKYYPKADQTYKGLYGGIYFRDIGNQARGGLRGGINIGAKVLFDNQFFMDVSFGFGRTSKNVWSSENSRSTDDRADAFMRYTCGLRF